jgi:hypothetical protein
VRASAWFPDAQLEIRAAAAVAALGCGAEGTGDVVVEMPVVVVPPVFTVVVVEEEDADAGVFPPPTCSTRSANPLTAIAASTRT